MRVGALSDKLKWATFKQVASSTDRHDRAWQVVRLPSELNLAFFCCREYVLSPGHNASHL